MYLAVVFLPLIEKELGEFVHYWNTHCIRQSNGNCVGGIPDDIYDMPQHYGKQLHGLYCCIHYFLLATFAMHVNF